MACYTTNFPVSPVTPSPVYTTDPATINNFITKAEALWNWIIGIFKDDVTDIGTFKHFLKELEDNCGGVKLWATADAPYAIGSLVYDANGNIWFNKLANNSEEPSLTKFLKPDNWALLGDNRKVGIFSCADINVATTAELITALEYASHKKLFCNLNINLTAGTYNATAELNVAGTVDGTYEVIIKGNGATISSSAGKIFRVRGSNVQFNNLTFKGNGSNIGLYTNDSSITGISLTFVDCGEGLAIYNSGYIYTNGITATNCKTAVRAFKGGTIECANSNVTTNIANSRGFDCSFNSKIECDSSEVTGATTSYYSSMDGTLSALNSKSTTTGYVGYYVDRAGTLIANSSTCTGGTHSSWCESGGTLILSNSTLSGGATSACTVTKGGFVDVSNVGGNGLVSLWKGGTITASTTTGVTFSQTKDAYTMHGVIYS